MKLEFLENVNTYSDHIVRLYDFDFVQAEQFRQTIHRLISDPVNPIDLATLGFIEAVNCQLRLCVSENDNGIVENDQHDFCCELTITSYRKMADLLQPFCLQKTKGYQWLYDVDTPVDLLFSPLGTWQYEHN